MFLSPNFTLEEFTTSETAYRKRIDNTPTPLVLAQLKKTAKGAELVREILKNPIFISSGYRSPALNKFIGGASKSQHVEGKAIDFTCPAFGTPRQIVEKLKSSGVEFDQLILEFDRWVHISFNEGNNRRQVLVIDNNGTRVFS
jgi:hypothetical protein